MMPASYRAAIIGCGKMSRGHAHAYVADERVRLVAGADVSEGARAAFAGEFGVDCMYADPVEMLERERPDLVSVCTWPPLHAEAVAAAFAAGVRGVWCEKPMAVHLGEARAMVAAAQRAGGVLVINHQRRYMDAYRQARELIDDGAIGEVTQITGICAGDVLSDGTHLVDMARYLASDAPVRSVFGAIDMTPKGDVSPDGMGTIEFNRTRLRYGHHIESGALALVTFEGGLRAHLEIGNLARGGYQRFFIDGTEGRVELSGDQPFADGSRTRVRRADGPFQPLPPTTMEGAMERVLADTIASLETGAAHPLRGEAALEVMDAVTAIFESARRRMTVTLPLDVIESPLEAMLAAGEIAVN